MGWCRLDTQTMRGSQLVPDPPAGHAQGGCLQNKQKKRQEYAFQRHFHEIPSIVLGCPGAASKRMQAALPLKHKQ